MHFLCKMARTYIWLDGCPPVEHKLLQRFSLNSFLYSGPLIFCKYCFSVLDTFESLTEFFHCLSRISQTNMVDFKKLFHFYSETDIFVELPYHKSVAFEIFFLSFLCFCPIMSILFSFTRFWLGLHLSKTFHWNIPRYEISKSFVDIREKKMCLIEFIPCFVLNDKKTLIQIQ